jgi:hypothetical protein
MAVAPAPQRANVVVQVRRPKPPPGMPRQSGAVLASVNAKSAPVQVQVADATQSARPRPFV